MKKLLIVFLIGCAAGAMFLKVKEHLAFELPAPVATLPDGASYQGDLVRGVLEGEGRMTWPNGDRYAGSFKNGQFHGRGRLEFIGGAVYEGEFTNGAITGTGVMLYANGDRYTGELKYGRANGKGIFDSGGNHYEGEFRDDRYHGEGRLADKDGNVYTGAFQEGLFHGRGVYVAHDGRSYNGDFVEGDFTGTGVYTDKQGTHYEGGFKNWVFQGKGRLRDAKGDQYSGRFENGSLRGEGEYVGTDGTHYQGGFAYGRYHGQGRLRTAEGDVYAGGFRHGAYDGEGRLTYAAPLDNVTAVNGAWKDGNLVESGDSNQIAGPGALAEHALYNQNELLRRSWRRIRENDPHRIDMYFLGIAGDGEQAVFRREVLYVQDYFDRTFGTAGRSMVLINGPRTAREIPLATNTSIEKTLRVMARRMDAENDILFIYMTSHGSREFEFILDQPGMDLPELSAGTLAKILEELPVRWKVIVISACYAGGFIPALQDDHSLIITAAAADRTSFGCSDRSAFTYFGEAYFRDALPQGGDFAEAFEKAAEIVRQRETAQHEENSKPQIHKPAAILKHLQQWRAELRAAGKLAGRQTGQ